MERALMGGKWKAWVVVGFVPGLMAVPAAAAASQGAAKPAETRTSQSAKPAPAPRMSDGKPDLQGVWNYATATPLERPAELAGKEFLTEEEAARFQEKVVASRSTDRRDGGAQADIGRAYNDF